MKSQTFDSNKFYIFDCNGNVCGNKAGYHTCKGANRCLNNPRHKAYRQVWDAFDANQKDKREHKLICSVRAGSDLSYF